ncbi:MAG TPA: DUF1800 domain-containing protein [Gemmataceae bacterium]|jgi:uncharacterized protein (DUF1800 family)|nr:DUF1800 domain-containing protein [Gemmataceae bacterium]
MADRAIPSLEKVDPAKAWLPWEPTKDNPWNIQWAGHLYRRAAFGAGLADLRAAVKRGHPATIDLLMTGDKDSSSITEDKTEKKKPRGADVYDLRGWWLDVMLHSPHPFQEKMTLFWHNHFATSIEKVGRFELMIEQNQRLREYALGKFGSLLVEMSRDSALLFYLDADSNKKDSPNENLARELLELFTLGVGNYGESDVRAAALALTGWQSKGSPALFVEKEHDDSLKKFLGQEGKWHSKDIVRIILKQPAVSRFLVRKLYSYLVSEAQEPPAALLEPLAESFRKSDYDTAALAKTILSSRLFYSVFAYHQRIKSPVEFVLGAIQAVAPNMIDARAQVGRLESMGQQLFAPPNVKGWPGGRSWLNTGSILARHNFAQALSSGSGSINRDIDESRTPPIAIAVDPAALLRQDKVTAADEIVSAVAKILLQGELNNTTRTSLIAFIKDGSPPANLLDKCIRDTFHAIMCSPEYQLA